MSRLGDTGAVADAVFAAFPHLVPGLDRTPDPGLGIDPDALTRADLVEAMSSDRFTGFAQALQRVGNCARPIRLHGHSTRIDANTGEILSHYSSGTEPLGITHVRCGNRRETVC